MKCTECGHALTPEQNFCPSCGTPRAEENAKCAECGHELSPEQNFCPSCGTPSATAKANAEPNPAENAGAPAGASPETVVAPDTVTGGTANPSAYTYKSIQGLSKALLALFALSIVVGAVALISTAMEIEFINKLKLEAFFTSTEAEIDRMAAENDQRQALVGFTQLGVIIVTAIVFLVWAYRINSNAHTLTTKDMHYGPNWTVGSFFVPIVNLFVPYRAFREMMKVHLSPDGWERKGGNALVLVWWLAFLFSSAFNNLAGQLYMKANDIDAILGASLTMFASDAFTIVATVPVIMLILKFQKLDRQNAPQA